jgi:hypothetical protein
VILEWAKSCALPPVIIVDSLRAFLDGANENDAAVIRTFFDKFKLLTKLGCAIIVLHHGGRNENNKQWRGSSDIKAAITTAYFMENLGGCDELGPLRLTAFKKRARTVSLFRIKVTSDGEFWLEPEEYQQPRQLTAEDKFKNLLQEHPGSTSRQIDELAKTYGLSRDTVRGLLKQWKNEKPPRVRAEAGLTTNAVRWFLNWTE